MKPEPQSTHTQLENLSAGPIELGLVLDRSDSMNHLASTTIAAFNTLLAEQQRKLNAAATRASLLLFNESCETVFDGCPLVAVSGLSPSTYQPSGSTVLWDGLGTMIETIGARVDSAPAVRVLIVTITDGEENASRRYELEQLRGVI